MVTTMKRTARELLTVQYGKDTKMIDFCEKNSLYLQLDGVTVEVCKAKPSITKTIWYDDEGTTPDSGYESFINANKFNMPHLFEMEGKWGTRLSLCVNYYNDKTQGELVGLQYVDENKAGTRFVTEDELTKINQIVQTAIDDYKKRLTSYYTKYASKVRACGYWANR